MIIFLTFHNDCAKENGPTLPFQTQMKEEEDD